VSNGDSQQEPYKALIEGREDDVPEDKVSPQTPAQPRNLYAASKVWSESLARVYAHSHDLSCLCIRIGWVTGEDESRNGRGDIWCSQRDIAELIKCCIDADEEVRFDIFYGMSDNKRRWVDIEYAQQRVGYVSQDRAED
jgi:nucleoside-diphosphate-sugar epimerase